MNGQSSIMPEAIVVRFSGKRCSGLPSGTVPAWYTKEVTIKQAGFDTVKGFNGKKYFHDTALALFSSGGTTPTNQAALDNLATEIAIQYYNWIQESFDESYPQIINPNPIDATTDTIEFTYTQNQIQTRRYSSPYNGEAEELQHNDPANSACIDVGSTIVSKAPCFESYGPSIGGTTSNVSFPVYKNCFQDGMLTQTYVRTESIDCGCEPPKCSVLNVILTGKCPLGGMTSLAPFALHPELWKDGSFVSNGVYQSGTTWGFTNVTHGSGYVIKVPDTNDLYHAAETPPFTVGPTCASQLLDIYPWVGWQTISGSVSGCGGPLNGSSIVAIQNGVSSSTTSVFNPSTGLSEYILGPFLDFDPATYVPYPVTLTITDPDGRWIPKVELLEWIDVPFGFRCSKYSPVYNAFTPSTCPSTNNDVQSPYFCNGLTCAVPVKKQIQIEDSVYGTVTLNFDNRCNTSGRPVYIGTLSASSPGCTKEVNCNGIPVVLSCPSNTVTLTYQYIFGDLSPLTITWKVTTIPCPAPNPLNQGLPCPSDSGTTLAQAGPAQTFPPGRSLCGITLFDILSLPPITGFCNFPSGSGGFTSNMYPAGATFTLTEAP